MKKMIKTICASIALVMVASTVAQAGIGSNRVGLSSCERAVFAKYQCGDDVFVAGSKEAICWANLDRGIKRCKIFERIKAKRPMHNQTNSMKRAN